MVTLLYISLALLTIVMAGISFATILMVRNKKVAELRTKVMREEEQWINQNLILLEIMNWEGDDARRYNQLPSYNEMLYRFWIPVNKFEQRLRKHGYYYFNLLICNNNMDINNVIHKINKIIKDNPEME